MIDDLRNAPRKDPASLPAGILLVDDDAGVIQILSKVLQPLGRIRFALGGADALRLMAQEVPDLVLLDAEMPQMSGFRVFEAMQDNALLAKVPVIFVTSHGEESVEQAGLDLGAADFIAKPIRPTIVHARVRTQLRLKRALDEVQRLASTDDLTGIANRRSFDEAMAREWAVAERSARPLALLFIDIDYFKRFNDHYGHQLGDDCLRAVARCIRDSLHRPGDQVYRYGGEEFVVLLPDTDARGANDVGQRILNRIEAMRLEHAASELGGHVTVSAGLSTIDAGDQLWPADPVVARELMERAAGPQELVKAADMALFAAKKAGRAQLCSLPIGAVVMQNARDAGGTELECLFVEES